ncbi:hypothetical protein B0H34DRAFT_803025 [Crassisporium funariophilum]|nr:hypothetical protein B0H34DRAFT_803025 [Crassisporium funariophilum]
MAAVCKSKSKAKRSLLVSLAHSLEMPVEGNYGNRKHMVSASSNSGSEVEVVKPLPTKRHKKVAPGSPEYWSQPAVVITSKSVPKPLRRKLSFGLLDNNDAALDAVRSVSKATSLEDKGEASPAQNPSQKAVYMASTPARREKEDQVAQKSRHSSGKKQTAKSMEVDTPSDLEIMSGIVAPSPTKKSALRPNKKTASLPAVKHKQGADVKLRSPSRPAPCQSKGKLFVETYHIRPNLSLCSGIDCPVSSPVFSDDTPKAKGQPSATITKAHEKHRTLHESPTAVITKDTDMMDGFLSPGDQVQGVADTHSSHLCIIRPTNSNKTPAYAPADLRDPSTDKPIFLQSNVFPSMFEEPALLREVTSSYGSSQPQVSSVRRKRNIKASGSSASAPPAALWYEKNFPPFVDYNQDIPIYDAQSQPFMFTKDDFATLPLLPHYKNLGNPKNADLPANGLVSVFFSMITYASARVPPTPGSSSRLANDPQTPVATGSSSRSNASSRSDSNFKVPSQVLSLNLQFVVYHGQVPGPDDND